MGEVTTFESVATELDERAEGAELAMLIGGDDYTKGVGVAYREAAALVRARALPAMDREGLIECICEHCERHGDMAAPNLADAILARFAPPAPVVTEAMVEAGARAMWESVDRTPFGPWGWQSEELRENLRTQARACLTSALGTPQPAQASEPARVEVGDEAIERARRAYSSAMQNGVDEPGEGTRVQRAWRAAFAAANVVPRAELERELRRQRDDLGESYAQVHDRLRADLAAATQRAEAAERTAHDTADLMVRAGDELRAEIATWKARAIAAERERDEARATLARLGTREAAERVANAYHHERNHSGDAYGCMHRALTAVLGAPAAEPAPAPVTREQFESLARRVTALDESVMQLMRESGAKGGAQ